MIGKLFDKKVVLALISLFFALILFVTANLANYSSIGARTNRNTVETYSHTLENVPIDIKYDSNQYFISGYSYETEVYLTSTNRVKLDGEINSDTRRFKVVADLTNISEGVSKVTLQVKDLPSDVTAEVSPKTMNVTVGKRRTKSFPVHLDELSLAFADGYVLSKAALDVETVDVTSDETTIEQIDHVRAVLSDEQPLTSDGEYGVTLQAVSSTGTILPTVINPAKVVAFINVRKLTKTVPVRIELVGEVDSSLSQITYEAQYTEVVISGSQDSLDQINEIVATVDIANIKKNTTKPIPLTADGVTVTPATMSLKLTVTKKASN